MTLMNALQEQFKIRLKYDESIYDNAYTQRIILKRILAQRDHEYQRIRIPSIKWYEDDLEHNSNGKKSNGKKSNGKIIEIAEEEMTNEFWTFYNEFKRYPSILIKLYPPDVILDINQSQIKQTRDKIIRELSITNLIFYVPICYSEHYGANYQSFINVMCFICPIDENLENYLPEKSERFYVFKLELNDIENKTQHFSNLKIWLLNNQVINPNNDSLAYQLRTIVDSYDILVSQHNL